VRCANNVSWVVEVANPRDIFDAGATVTMSWAPEHTLLLRDDASAVTSAT